MSIGGAGTGGSTTLASSLDAAPSYAGAARLAWIALQAVGVLALIWMLRIESPAFYERVAPMAIGGAIVHHLLPARLRLGFFSFLSIATIWLLFGLEAGAWLVGIGTVLIAICHFPIALRWRVVLLLLTGALLAAMCASYLPTRIPGAIWAILGSMFMFRLILYVYDLRHLKTRTTWEERFAYFFCLPNVAFPLFPVIDFATFRRTYYDRAAAEIYQEGVAWILRGLTHLVLYRLIYQHLIIAPVEMRTASDFMQYAVTNYGLYLRVSGQFHLIVGLLHLFGFRLPETHRFFYLASSITDFWRRINIYWKDFMQKVFYLPLFLRLMRAHGELVAMVISTVVVFTITWFFHAYQWFWILGVWLWSATDAMFWCILGLLVIGNSLLEIRRGRTRTLGTKAVSLQTRLRHGAQVAMMFMLLCALWTLWTSPTLGTFGAMVRGVSFGARDLMVLVALWAAIAATAALTYRRAQQQGSGAVPSRWAPVAAAVFLAGVALGAMPVSKGVLPAAAHEVLARTRDVRLNMRDEDQLQRGYYEQLVGVNRFSGELWTVYARRPVTWGTLRETGAMRRIRDPLLEELVPGMSVVFHGGQFTVNEHGLRDRPYTLDKPSGVLRIAILGQSYVMGSGVHDNETFENVLEDRLTREWAPAHGYERVEILNFGAPSFSAQQQRLALERGKVTAFAPDVVFLVGHSKEVRHVTEYVIRFLDRRIPGTLPDTIAAAVAASGLRREMEREEALQRLAPATPRLLAWLYRDMAAMIRASGATPVFAHIPMPMERDTRALGELLRAAGNAGFAMVLDFDTVFQEYDGEQLILAEWDRHPNAEGHRIIADALFDALAPELAGIVGGAGR